MDVLAGGLTRDVAVGYAVRDGPSRGVGASVAAVVFRSGLGVGCADAHRRRCVFIRMTAFFIRDVCSGGQASAPLDAGGAPRGARRRGRRVERRHRRRHEVSSTSRYSVERRGAVSSVSDVIRYLALLFLRLDDLARGAFQWKRPQIKNQHVVIRRPHAQIETRA